jgi:hypothetical protein
MTTTEINDRGKKGRGAPYDGALKMLRLASHRQLCARVGKPVPDTARIEKEVELPGFALRVDLILHVGPHQLMHIEFETRPGRDLAQRLLYYASRMLRLDKHCRIVQIVVILGPHGDSTGIWEQDGIRIQFEVIKLREEDPEWLLASADIAPFAALGRAANKKERIDLLSRAFTVLSRAHLTDEYRRDLVYVAAVLAGIYLSTDQVKTAWKESAMGNSLAHLPEFLRDYAKELEIEMLTSMIRRKFGDAPDIDQVAQRLASLGSEAAADALFDAKTLDELRG